MNISIGGYSFYNTFLEGKMDVFGYLETVKYRYRMDAVDLWNGFFIDRAIAYTSLLIRATSGKSERHWMRKREGGQLCCGRSASMGS